MKGFLKLAAKAAAVTLGALMVFAILFAYGASIVFKHKDPVFKQELIVEIKHKKKVNEYYCTKYVHDAHHNCIILIDHKGNKVLHLYKNENTLVEIKLNFEYDPDVLREDLKKEMEKLKEERKELEQELEEKLPKKMV